MDIYNHIRITPEGHIRTTSSSLYDYIVSYVPFPTINKMVGDPIALPNTVTVTRKSGKVETLTVKWEPASTDVAGTFGISGGVDYSVFVVTQIVVVSQLTDLDILRQIRDANPGSSLQARFDDAKDPYTEWEIGWSVTSPKRALIVDFINDINIKNVPNINKLTKMTRFRGFGSGIKTVDFSGLSELISIDFDYGYHLPGTGLTQINISGCISLIALLLAYNKLASIPSLISKGLIIGAKFTNNLMLTPETDRLLAMGFTSAQVLPQDI